MPLKAPTRLLSSRATLAAALMVLAAGSVLSIVAVTRHQIGAGPTGLELAAVVVGGLGLLAVFLGFRALVREARERQVMEREIRASEKKFSGILSIAADAIITIDASQRIVHFNRGAEEIFGWAKADVLGQPLERLIPERFRGAHTRHIGHFRSAPDVSRRMGERQEIFGLRRNGDEFPAEASISKLESGGEVLFTVVLRDITERKRQERDERFLARSGVALSGSLDYESTLRSVVHLAIPHLADCCVLDVSESAGDGREAPLFRRVASVHEDPDLTRTLRALETRRIDDFTFPFPVGEALVKGDAIVRDPLPDGWWQDDRGDAPTQERLKSLGLQGLLTIPLVARERSVGALTLLSSDAARHFTPERRAVAESLAHLAALAIDNAWLYHSAQRASQARDEILGAVSHDLRNPLSAISMLARVLLNSAPEGAVERQELVAAILESTELMNRLIQDLLDVAMIESGHLAIDRQPEEMHDLVERVLDMVNDAARQRGVVLQVDLPSSLPPVLVDAGRVSQVLANLLANAIKFTDSGGSVMISALNDDRVVTIAVRDTGVGIPPEHLPHIFDRYWHARRTARTVGTGLGLAISRGIVEAHGGRLWAESVPGQGSTFRFTVPVATETGSLPDAADPMSEFTSTS